MMMMMTATATTATAIAMNKSTRISKYCTEKIMNCSCSSSSRSRRSTNVLFFPGKTSAMEQKQSRSSRRRRRPTIVLKKAMMIDDDDDEKRDRNTAKADEDEFQVFRFTLGITGFDDSEIPKALGVISAALLIANKVASNGQLGVSSSAAAQRGDMIGFFLVLASVATPYISRRIEEATTGNSRARSSSREQSIDISGGSSQFLCNERFKERKQTNYAWASYALLTNTNAKGLAFFEDDGKTMSLARGSVRTIVIDDGKNSNDEEILMKLAKGFSYDEITNNKERKKKEKKKNNDDDDDDDDDDTKNIVYYLSNRMELDGVGANLWEFLPPGAESAVIRRAETGSKGILVAYSDEPRAFNKKARLWIGQLAEKMSTDD